MTKNSHWKYVQIAINYTMLIFVVISICPNSIRANSQDPIEWLNGQEVDFGKKLPNSSTTIVFRFLNKGDNPVIVTHASSSCNCAPVNLNQNPVFPDEISEIVYHCKFYNIAESFFRQSLNVYMHTLSRTLSYTLIARGNVTRDGSFDEYANKTYRKFENTITIHIQKSPSEIDWQGDASDVLLSLANNQYIQNEKPNRPIGHVTVELNCVDENQNKIRRIGGQGIKNVNDISKKILEEGYGFTVLLQPKDRKGSLSNYPLLTVNGKFENEATVTKNNDLAIWNGLMNFASFMVRPEQCMQMVDYFDKYVNITEESCGASAGNKYGFGADANHFEGAGCATFAEEFLKLTDYNFYPENFYQIVHIPFELFGNPSNGKFINIQDLIFSDVDLGTPSEDSIQLSFPDPNKLHQLVMAANSKHATTVNSLPVVEKGSFGSSKSVYSVFDIRNCVDHSCQ